MFGRKISRLGLRRAALTLGFRNAARSQLQLRLRCLWLQSFLETLSCVLCLSGGAFLTTLMDLEKIAFFNDSSCLGSPLTWFGFCLEEPLGCGFVCTCCPCCLSNQNHLLSLLPPALEHPLPHVQYLCVLPAPASVVWWGFPGQRTQAIGLQEAECLKNGIDRESASRGVSPPCCVHRIPGRSFSPSRLGCCPGASHC